MYEWKNVKHNCIGKWLLSYLWLSISWENSLNNSIEIIILIDNNDDDAVVIVVVAVGMFLQKQKFITYP